MANCHMQGAGYMEKTLKYYDLMEDIRAQILSGDIKPGEKIPSENQLSETYGVSRQTVRKALQILQNEGYLYAEHGRGTFCSERMRHTKKSKNIAVITTYLSDYIFPSVIRGIDEVLTENGYSILLKNTRNSRKMEAKCLEELLQKDIDGLIIEPSKSQIFCRHMNLYEMLDEYQIPYVFIQGSYGQMQEKPHVLLDDNKGGYLITKYLIEQGHKDIVGVFKSDDTQGQERHKGYVQALQEAGIAYDPEKVIWFYTEDRKSHPYEMIRRMVKERDKKFFDAVVAYNDQIAIEIMQALEDEGLSVPEDVSVAGYDDSYLAKTCKVPLTTVAHPQEELGAIAAQLLLRIIKEGTLEEKENRIIIEPELVIRDSVKKTTCEHEHTSYMLDLEREQILRKGILHE